MAKDFEACEELAEAFHTADCWLQAAAGAVRLCGIGPESPHYAALIAAVMTTAATTYRSDVIGHAGDRIAHAITSVGVRLGN